MRLPGNQPRERAQASREQRGALIKPAWYETFGDTLGGGYQYPWVPSAVPDCDYLEGVLAAKPSARMLDVGCGVGRHATELAKRGTA